MFLVVRPDGQAPVYEPSMARDAGPAFGREVEGDVRVLGEPFVDVGVVVGGEQIRRERPAGITTIRYSRGMRSQPVTAAAVLREARRRAGLSQVELAARAGVTQSVISAYESGRRQPAMSTLTALVDATGYDLTISLRRQSPGLRGLSGPVGRRVRRRRRALVEAAAAHGVSNLRVFGSVARGRDRADSDVDLLVDLPPGLGLFGLGRVVADLEAILGSRVDLVPAQDLKPEVRTRVERELVPL
jgi:predicted nucleotidyltransferase/DNA-binding XRE family transcriptional regulator